MPTRAALTFRVALMALVPLLTAQCGSDAESSDAPPALEAEGGPREASATGDAGGATQVPECRSAATVQALGACIDAGSSPRDCLAKSRPAGSAACDADKDGLDDALEDAMLRSYAPVFAYNKGDGSHTAGDSEPNFPTNMRHYVASSTLIWRVDGDESTRKVVDAKPTLDGLRAATFTEGTAVRHADVTSLGQGPNFWLCLNQVGGSYPADALVSSVDISSKLQDGIDLLSVAHPSGADPSGRYVVLEYMLFYAYNKFSFDDHEGDFEGGAVFVDTETGKVAALYTDRHATSDGTLVVPLEGPGLLPAKDPKGEAPHYNICDDSSTNDAGGVRFWDYAAKRHHPVIFAAAGGHASYGYPGATKIQGAGCFEATMIRDVHNGGGPKLVPFESAYYTDWNTGKAAVEHDVRIVNLGERKNLVAQWSAFAGQWGCTLQSIPKSYPGPWDNARLCRHWLTNDWGPAPPFARSTATTCSQ